MSDSGTENLLPESIVPVQPLPPAKATKAAYEMAEANSINLDRVVGSGKNGTITKKDVEDVIATLKRLDEAEEKLQSESIAVDEQGQVIMPPSSIFTLGRYERLYHFARTIHPMGGIGEEIKTPDEIKERIENSFFAEGWELFNVEPLGYGPDGLSMLWIFGKVKEGFEPLHKKIYHVQRTLGSNLMEGQLTGFSADAYLETFFEQGWSIFAAKPLSRGGAEVPMVWVFVQ